MEVSVIERINVVLKYFCKTPNDLANMLEMIPSVGVLHTELRCGAINEGGTLSGYATDEDGNDVDVSSSIKRGQA